MIIDGVQWALGGASSGDAMTWALDGILTTPATVAATITYQGVPADETPTHHGAYDDMFLDQSRPGYRPIVFRRRL